MIVFILCFFFFFNDTATTEIYTLSLHDALPIWRTMILVSSGCALMASSTPFSAINFAADRKSTRLNSSHITISYAVFCLKKKKTKKNELSIIKKTKKQKKQK